MIIFLPLLFLSNPVGGFVASPFPGFSCSFFANQQTCPTRALSAAKFNPLQLGSVSSQGTQEVDDAPLLALNGSLIDATALAESKTAVGAYQITRPRWYNRAEAAVIVLLVQELRLLDVRGVEHMLEATDAFRKQDAVSSTCSLVTTYVREVAAVCRLRILASNIPADQKRGARNMSY